MKNMYLDNRLVVGDYIIVNDKYYGSIIKIIWNSNGYIIKLDNEPTYIDKTLIQYKLIDNENIQGYMLITLNDKISKLNIDNIINLINTSELSNLSQIQNKINKNWNEFIKKIGILEINNIESNPTVLYDHVYNKNKYPIYDLEAGKEDNYTKYITEMINSLFIDNNIIKWEESFIFGDGNSIDILGEENIDDSIKPILISVLERFDSIDMEQYYDFKNTLMYKHLIYDEDLDMLSLGKQLIIKIKEILINLQKPIQLDDNINLLETTNLFDFLKFRIIGGYVEITNNNNDNSFRVITPELIPNLSELKFQYSKPIDYNYLSTIILKNKTSDDVIINKLMIDEALKILSQEYIICFQPKIELLLWTVCRLIICWYADMKLYENIFKIKILINTFRSRGQKEFNKDMGVQPLIMIYTKYGKKIATKVLSHLSYFFFPYKKLGWESSKPTWFDNLDNLMHYTNGSLEIKKYIKFLLQVHVKFNNPLSKDMTQINILGIDNKIEYQMPFTHGDQINLELEKYKLLQNQLWTNNNKISQPNTTNTTNNKL